MYKNVDLEVSDLVQTVKRYSDLFYSVPDKVGGLSSPSELKSPEILRVLSS